jgi:hypothetical protein
MHWKTLALSLALTTTTQHVAASPAHNLEARQFATAAMLRFQCSQLVIDRIDPLVQPGVEPAAHMHQIVGGNAFNVSMPASTLDPSLEATCTTCDFSEDLSNYWTANLYFKARNGSFARVPQMVNLGLQGRQGVTVYYIPPYDGKSTVTAFPKGFRMLVGDPGLRKAAGQQKQLCHRCFTNKAQDPFGGAPCMGPMDSFDLPKGMCGGGIRTTITFPTYLQVLREADLELTLLTDAGTARTSTRRITKTTSCILPLAPSNLMGLAQLHIQSICLS